MVLATIFVVIVLCSSYTSESVADFIVDTNSYKGEMNIEKLTISVPSFDLKLIFFDIVIFIKEVKFM